MAAQDSRSLTVTAVGGLLRVLKSQCGICQAFDPTSATPGSSHPAVHEFEAIWDTGASTSVITQNVIDRCGLSAIGMAQVHNAQTTTHEEVFLVNILLPNQVGFVEMKVIRGRLPGGSDVLIGMDIIAMGDFAVTNLGGITKFTFRCPSMVHIDFVQEHQTKNAAPQGS